MKNNKIPAPKFFPGEKIYCYTKEGLELCTIDSVHIGIYVDSINVNYYILENRNQLYSEDQIIDSVHKAKKKIESNLNQLQLAIG